MIQAVKKDWSDPANHMNADGQVLTRVTDYSKPVPHKLFDDAGANSPFDLNRGLITKVSKADESGIHMYVDDPGHYYNGVGIEVDELTAKRAGFDTEHDKLEMRKRERLERARTMEIERWEAEEAAIKRGEYTPLPSETVLAPKVVPFASQSPSPQFTDEGYAALKSTE